MKDGPIVGSKTASSVCAQCGSRLDSNIGGDRICINCLLRSALDQDDHDPDKTARRSDHLLSAGDGAPIEFGDYKLLEEVGRGSQGVVYRAHQKSLNRTVALKVISVGQWASKAHVKRFRREAEAAASLNHPCIVPVYEVGEREGACYFSMRFVEGGQLDGMARRTPLSVRHAAELIAKVARTVHYAHEHGIVHRDIKPGNILLDSKSEPHLTDFGLARLAETESTITRTREVIGTPSYMAPEQAAGETTQVSRATDVYGLGAVLYQLLTGHPPFAGGTSYETVRLVLDTEPRSPRVLNCKVDRELSTICLKCLEKDPKRRYSSALALAEDLEHWLKHEPIQARRTGIFTRGRKWLRRKPALAAVISLSFALALAIGWNSWKSEFIRHPATNGIAVLPFENLSADPNNAYFAEGMQEEILTRLAKIAGLKVISRASTQRYQGKPRNLIEIAKQLGVANILEGSVQKAATQVRVNVQLINAETDSHLWADTYDRKLTDILGVESEIAKEIAAALQVNLTRPEQQALTVKPTNNPEAYDTYLHGLAFDARSRSAAMFPNFQLVQEAIGSYEKAVQLDPKFAFAWARLSRAEAVLCFNNIDTTPATRCNAAKTALEHAQQLQPDSPETLLALGYYQYWVLHDYGAAKRTFAVAGKVLPSSSEVPVALGRVTRREGHWDQSIAYYEQALTLDPRDWSLLMDAAWTYTMVRQFPAALKLYDRVLDMTPNDGDVKASKAGIYQAQGNLPEAAKLLSEIDSQASSEDTFRVKITQLRLERNYGEAIRLLQSRQAQFHFGVEYEKAEEQVHLALMHHLAGNTSAATVTGEQARNTLVRLYGNQPDDGFNAVLLSEAYAAMGEKDSALQQAERAKFALDPGPKDAISGPRAEENLALIETMVGKNNDAISTLSQVLQTPYNSWLYIPAPITPAFLRLDPLWDPLRSDPAFQKLCEAKQSVAFSNKSR
jgi:eukaryotic-like serine/threonine-protein kinase